LGRKDEARNIFLTAAQALHQKGALDAADEALKKVISLDPNNVDALLLRGKIASDSGDSTSATKYLEKVPDLDSRPEALQALLNAKLQAGRYDDARTVAQRLLNTHNDASGIVMIAEALMTAGEFERALEIYAAHTERFFSGNSEQLINTLISSINRVKESAGALAKLRSILQRASDQSHINEVTELLAHAYVQEGQLASAGELYKELSELEPQNPLHAQNYKQIQAKLGQDSAQRELTAEEGAQALMVDELELEMPVLEQNYPAALREAVKAAITEAELFESYNMPGKATAPLESARAKAPRDAQLNQRLASLYSRSGRLEDAAKCCEVLQAVFAEAGHAKHAQQYGDMAVRYRERIGAAAAVTKVEFDASFMPADIQPPPPPAAGLTTTAAMTLEQPKSSVTPEFELEVVRPPAPVEVTPPAPMAELTVEVDTAEHAAATPAAAHEIDLSEWETMTTVEETAAVPQPSPPAPVAVPPPPVKPAAPPVDTELVEAVEEVKFYISQAMWKEAEATLARVVSRSPKAPGVADLQRQVQAGLVAQAATMAKAEPSLAEFSVEVEAPEPPVQAPPPKVAPKAPPAKPAAPAIAASAKAAPAPAKAKDALADFVLDLDESLGDDFAFGSKPASAPSRQKPTPTAPAPLPARIPAPIPGSAPVAAASAPARTATLSQEEASSALSDMFAEFKEDVEQGVDSSEPEDPDTHYNLGVAFKEMGLLDEAIGELQKVCHAIDRGQEFTQIMQAYTWLAHCFVEKGVPEASVKWYEKALKVASADEQAKMAVHYELAAAHEAAGNKKAALDNFMEVYGSNIDYRDVAERIKALKA
jgi:tetratricopeptide (TPR) repeat protein